MNETWISILGVVGLFILRLGVPLAITLAIGYWLRRLDAKWQAEAAQERDRLARFQLEDQSPPSFEPQPKLENLVVEGFRVTDQPCWVFKDCPESMRLNCPAYQHPYLLCWMARRHATGQVPVDCYQCALFPLQHVAQKV
jgi:hypothetical protein